jgi:enamine deaminase RidA (YjgF/YER057c/UK114 family)
MPAALALLAALAAADSPVRSVRPDDATGSAAAVVVGAVPLVHTEQMLPGPGFDDDIPAQFVTVFLRLNATLRVAGSSLDRAVKINFYVADLASVTAVQAALAGKFKGPHKPAVSFVQTPLPGGAAVAADAVAVGKRVDRAPDFAVLPAGSRVYVAGQAEKGKTLAEATRATLDSLRRSLAGMKLGDEHVVQAKAFLNPMAKVGEVRKAFADFYGAGKVPPLVFVEWGSANSIEIELIAASPLPRDKTADVLEFLTPAGMTTPTVYSRVCRVHAPETVYVSGLYSRQAGDGAAQVTDIFEQFRGLLGETGSDFRHLVKATYYVSDDDASKKLNELRPRYYDPRRPPAASKAPVAGVGRAGRSITIDMIAVPGRK